MIFITKIRNDERFYSDRIHAEIQRTSSNRKRVVNRKTKKGFGTEKISLLIDHMLRFQIARIKIDRSAE